MAKKIIAKPINKPKATKKGVPEVPSKNDFLALAGQVSKLCASPFEVGKSYLIRTVTMIDVGEVKSADGQFIVLTKASWIADTGRFHKALDGSGQLDEIEMFKNDVIIAVGAIVDATEWTNPLPTVSK